QPLVQGPAAPGQKGGPEKGKEKKAPGGAARGAQQESRQVGQNGQQIEPGLGEGEVIAQGTEFHGLAAGLRRRRLFTARMRVEASTPEPTSTWKEAGTTSFCVTTTSMPKRHCIQTRNP